MASDFNLSEKIFEKERYGYVCEVNHKKIVEDVREFVRLLKERIILKSKGGRVRNAGNIIGHNLVLEIIDKLAGDKLK